MATTGKLDAALQDVEGALAVLIAPDGSSDGALFAKAYLRQVQYSNASLFQIQQMYVLWIAQERTLPACLAS